MSKPSMRDVALDFAGCGVAIFPCREADGRNGRAKAPYIPGGWHGASHDPGQIGSWWSRWPNAVLGLPCRMNGLIVLDADRHGQEDGVTALTRLFLALQLDPNSVPVVSTPRHGLHVLFRRPDDLGPTKAFIAPAGDIRDRAYVIAAGSTMANGLRYRLQRGSTRELAFAIGARRLLELPRSLAALVSKARSAIGADERQCLVTLGTGSLRHRLKGLVRAVALAPVGHRNGTLFWASCRIGDFVRAGLMDYGTAYTLALEAAISSGLAHNEATATIRSGFRTAIGGGHVE